MRCVLGVCLPRAMDILPCVCAYHERSPLGLFLLTLGEYNLLPISTNIRDVNFGVYP